MHAGGGGISTQIIAVYQPCGQRGRRTRGEVVWDQHSWYFEARGEIRDPQAMFKSDLLSLLRRWKASRDEILMMGNFNENVYSGAILTALAREDLRMTEICYWTTGKHLLSTHSCGSTPIDAVFGTTGLVCSVASLLPFNVGVGDHRIFIVDITSESILGDVLST